MGSTPLGYCWFIYKIGARTGRLTGQFETYAQWIGQFVLEYHWLFQSEVEHIVSIIPVTRYIKDVTERMVKPLKGLGNSETVANQTSTCISQQTKSRESCFA